MRLLDKLLVLGIIIGLLGACVSIARRVSVEAGNRMVEIAVDFGDVAELAGMTERDLPAVLADLKAAGVTSVAVYEDSLQSLEETGQAELWTERSAHFYYFQGDWGPARGDTGSFDGRGRLATHDLALMEQIREALSHKIAPEWGRRVSPRWPMTLPLTESQLKEVGLGFPEGLIRQIQDAGLAVVARPLTYPLMGPGAVDYIAETCAKLDARTLVFAGSSVMGNRALLGTTADTLKAHGLAYGSVEMGKQFGDAGLTRRLGGSVVRVHSISNPEMMGMSPQNAIARFVRAAKERGIRLCYVRLFGRSADDPYEAELDYLRKLSAGLAQTGFDVGRAHPPKEVSVPVPLRVIAAVGIVACVLLLLRRMFPISERWSVTLLVVGLALGALLALQGGTGTKGLALLAALCFPTLAVHCLSERLEEIASPRDEQRRPSLTAVVGRGALGLLLCSATTLIGGLYIAGLLATTLFMTHADQFAGVKLAQGLPLLAIAAVYAAGLWWRGEDGPAYWSRVTRTSREFFRAGMSNGNLILAVIVLVAAAFLIVRSGNEPGFEVSGIEMRARQFLEDTLIARPRTKEFLVGHPLLMLAPALALWGWRRAVPLCVLGGAVGQVSLLNTFCHIHTPFWFSVIRSLNGLWLGIAVGALLIVALHIVRSAVPAWAAPDRLDGDAGG